jgi:hypothetical protein
MIGTISLILLLMWGLFIFALHVKNDIFLYIASAGMILISVYTMVNGIEGVDNFVTKGLSVIQIGLAFIGIFAPLHAAINNYND